MRLLVMLMLISTLSIGQSDTDTVLIRQLDGIKFRAAKPFNNSAINLSRSQFLTMAGALEDPSRLLIKFPGLSTDNDQANSIIYHGLPAQYHKWSLYGARILNPNHLGNAGTITDYPSRSSGGVNMLSGQVIGNLEFKGSPNISSMDALAGSSDIKLRNASSNNVNTNLSLIGFEAGLDRLFKNGTSQLVMNYRYSTVGILTGLGLDFGGESINYQDFTAKYSINPSPNNNWNFYLSLGNNSNVKGVIEDGVTPVEIKELQDIDFGSIILLAGISGTRKINNNKGQDLYYGLEAIMNSSMNISHRNTDRIGQFQDITVNPLSKYTNKETLFSMHQDYTLRKPWRFSRTKWSVGYLIDAYVHDINLLVDLLENNLFDTITRGRNTTNLHAIPRLTASHMLPKDWILSGDIGFQGVTNLGDFKGRAERDYVMVGKLEANYDEGDLTGKVAFSRSAQYYEPEMNLFFQETDFIKSNNILAQTAYKGFGISAFYHRLTDIPYENGNYGFSAINQLDYLPLANNSALDFSFDGEADIAGVSLFLNKSVKSVNLTSNLTLLQSEYRALEVESRAPLDYGHIFNITASKSWRFRSNKSLGVSASFHHRGGARQNLVDLDNSTDWGYTNYSFDNQFTQQLADYYRADLRIFYKPSKRSTVSLDIQNITNRENDAYYYYEPVIQKSNLKQQLGMIPILSWRVYW